MPSNQGSYRAVSVDDVHSSRHWVLDRMRQCDWAIPDQCERESPLVVTNSSAIETCFPSAPTTPGTNSFAAFCAFNEAEIAGGRVERDKAEETVDNGETLATLREAVENPLDGWQGWLNAHTIFSSYLPRSVFRSLGLDGMPRTHFLLLDFTFEESGGQYAHIESAVQHIGFLTYASVLKTPKWSASELRAALKRIFANVQEQDTLIAMVVAHGKLCCVSGCTQCRGPVSLCAICATHVKAFGECPSYDFDRSMLAASECTRCLAVGKEPVIAIGKEDLHRSELIRMFRYAPQCRASRTLLTFVACNVGIAVSNECLVSPADVHKNVEYSPQELRAISKNTGMIVLSAVCGDQKLKVRDARKFVEFFAEGLTGAADFSLGCHVTLLSLIAYLRSEMYQYMGSQRAFVARADGGELLHYALACESFPAVSSRRIRGTTEEQMPVGSDLVLATTRTPQRNLKFDFLLILVPLFWAALVSVMLWLVWGRYVVDAANLSNTRSVEGYLLFLLQCLVGLFQSISLPGRWRLSYDEAVWCVRESKGMRASLHVMLVTVCLLSLAVCVPAFVQGQLVGVPRVFWWWGAFTAPSGLFAFLFVRFFAIAIAKAKPVVSLPIVTNVSTLALYAVRWMLMAPTLLVFADSYDSHHVHNSGGFYLLLVLTFLAFPLVMYFNVADVRHDPPERFQEGATESILAGVCLGALMACLQTSVLWTNTPMTTPFVPITLSLLCAAVFYGLHSLYMWYKQRGIARRAFVRQYATESWSRRSVAGYTCRGVLWGVLVWTFLVLGVISTILPRFDKTRAVADRDTFYHVTKLDDLVFRWAMGLYLPWGLLVMWPQLRQLIFRGQLAWMSRRFVAFCAEKWRGDNARRPTFSALTAHVQHEEGVSPLEDQVIYANVETVSLLSAADDGLDTVAAATERDQCAASRLGPPFEAEDNCVVVRREWVSVLAGKLCNVIFWGYFSFLTPWADAGDGPYFIIHQQGYAFVGSLLLGVILYYVALSK